MRQMFVPDKALIGRIKEDKGFIFPGIIDPFLQIFFADGRPGGIVGKAQVDKVH